LTRELGSKQLGLLHQLIPNISEIAGLINPRESTADRQVADLQEAARALDIQLHVVNASTRGEIDTAFESLARRAKALIVATGPLFLTQADQLAALATRHAIPTMYPRREYATAGGLISYGPSTEEDYQLLGQYAGRVLKGEKPGDLPVQRPTKFELVINLKTAKVLGLDVPPTLIALADEVIE
jgi:putative ABC transport system substrate-binding protein